MKKTLIITLVLIAGYQVKIQAQTTYVGSNDSLKIKYMTSIMKEQDSIIKQLKADYKLSVLYSAAATEELIVVFDKTEHNELWRRKLDSLDKKRVKILSGGW